MCFFLYVYPSKVLNFGNLAMSLLPHFGSWKRDLLILYSHGILMSVGDTMGNQNLEHACLSFLSHTSKMDTLLKLSQTCSYSLPTLISSPNDMRSFPPQNHEPLLTSQTEGSFGRLFQIYDLLTCCLSTSPFSVSLCVNCKRTNV